MRRSIILGALVLTASGLCAQSDVSLYEPGVTADRVTYFLPATSLRIQVTTEEQTYTPGEFCRYAERYLKMTGLSDKEEKKLTVRSVEIIPEGIPDRTQIYSVQFNSRSTASHVELTGDGILSAINAQPERKIVEKEQTAQAVRSRVNPRDYLTEEILMAGSTAKMAELTAQEIFSIRESRNAITRGQADYVPSDGESFRYILDNLDKQEKALLQMFEGTRETVTVTYTFDYIPSDTEKDKVLFRISDKLGILDPTNLAGSPVYISVVSSNILPASIPELQDSGKKSSRNDSSIRYRIPGRAKVRVYDSRQTYLEIETGIAQFGNVETLPAALLSAKSGYAVIFDTVTGNVKSISSPVSR